MKCSKSIKTFDFLYCSMEINNKQDHKTARIRFEAVGWKSLLQVRSGTTRILVIKSIVRGLGLERGQPIHSYIGEDENGRQIMVSYLDGKPRFHHKNP